MLSNYIVAGYGERSNEALPDSYGDPLGHLISALESDAGLIDSCRVPFVAMNVTHNVNPGRTLFGNNQDPNTVTIPMRSCHSDLSVSIGYGDHTFPTLTGTANIRHKTPDLYIEDLDVDMVNWNRVLPVVEGYVCRPVHIDNRIYLIDAAEHCVVGCEGSIQVSVIDFTELGDVTCVPFSTCTIGESDRRNVTLPDTYDLTDKSVIAVVNGRLIIPAQCKRNGQLVFLDISNVSMGYQQIDDKVLHGKASYQQSVYFPDANDFNYLSSDAYVEDSFLVIVDTPKLYSTYSSLGIRIGRHKFLYHGYEQGFLQNMATQLLCHTVTDRHVISQKCLLKSDRKFHPNHSVGMISDAVHFQPADTEDILIDSDMESHKLLQLFAIRSS